MSIETEVRSTLAGYAPLTALVGSRIALNAVAEGDIAQPAVVFSTTKAITRGLDGTMLATQAEVEIQCWAPTAAQAAQIADAAEAAIAALPASSSGAAVVGRLTAYSEELGMDGEILSVEWWA